MISRTLRQIGAMEGIGYNKGMLNLDIALFGPFQVRIDGELLRRFPTVKAQALLAYLAVEADFPQRRDRLIGLLWPDQPEAAARVSLRQTLYQLRQLIPPAALQADRLAVQLPSCPSLSIDIRRFVSLLSSVRSHHHAAIATCRDCLAHLSACAEIYRGDFLAQLSVPDSDLFEEWATLRREQFRREALELFDALGAAALQSGDAEQAARAAWRQIELDPLREPAHRQLIEALAWQGRRGEALAHYETCCRILADELGIAPAQETAALAERIRAAPFEAAPIERSVMPTPEQPPNRCQPAVPTDQGTPAQLPIPLTPLIGRAAELRRVAHLLADPASRLISIVGPGGIGKTHLALAATHASRAAFAQGVVFVALAGVAGAETFPAAIASALGFRFYQGSPPAQQLGDYLRERHILLVLDNCEHMLAGVSLVAELLQAAPHLKVLATSRTRLRLQSEHILQLGGLAFPTTTDDPGVDAAPYDAIELFIDSAQRVQPQLRYDPADLVAIARICRFVQGMPLAIVLAATWARLLTPAEIAEELAHNLDFLTSELSDVPERQRSMRAVFEHSWSLLGERERAVFAALAVFQGGCDYPAARAVAAATLSELLGLVDASLLRRNEDGRYELHELLRQFAAERLAEMPDMAEQIRDQHRAYYAARAAGLATVLRGTGQPMALHTIADDLENLRVACDTAIGHSAYACLNPLGDCIGRFFELRGRIAEGEVLFGQLARQLAAKAAEQPSDMPLHQIATHCLIWHATFARLFVSNDNGLIAIEQALRLIGRVPAHLAAPERAFALLELGRRQIDIRAAESVPLLEQSVQLYQQAGDAYGVAEARYQLGSAIERLGDYAEAEERVRESLAIFTMQGDGHGMARVYRSLGRIAQDSGRLDESEQWRTLAANQFRKLGDLYLLVYALTDIGFARIHAGRFDDAIAPLQEAITLGEQNGFRRASAWAADNLEYALIHRGQYAGRGAISKQSLATAQAANDRFQAGVSLQTLGMLALGRGEPDEALSHLRASLDVLATNGDLAVMEMSRSLLAIALCAQGALAEAQAVVVQTLQTVIAHRIVLTMLYTLPAAALLLAAQGQAEAASAAYAAAERWPLVAMSRWFADVVASPIQATEAVPEPVAAQALGATGDLWEAGQRALGLLVAGSPYQGRGHLPARAKSPTAG